MGTVTFDGRARPTTAWASDVSTGWGNFNSGGGAPASEAQNAYQNGLAVNKKVNSSSSRVGIDFDPGSNAANMSGDAQLRTWFCKCYIADFGDLNATYGCEVGLGSANNQYYEYNIAGSGANNASLSTYPPQGGYLIIAINPTVLSWREATVGSPSLTAVDYFHFAAVFINGTAKAENLALDAIDIGRGLYITGTSASGGFLDFQDADQDTTTNRWGVVTGNGVSIVNRGLLTIGANSSGAQVTDFNDATTVVQFADGYQDAGDVGVLVNLGNASTTVDISCSLIGLGKTLPVDTRPDFDTTGTSGSMTLSAILTNFRQANFNSAVTIDGATIEAKEINLSGAEVKNSTIITNEDAGGFGAGAVKDPTFGTSSGIHDTNFIQGPLATRSALVISAAGSYTFTNIGFSGYAATGNSAAAVYITALSGTVNITVDGGDTPTYFLTLGSTATVNIIAGAVSVAVTAIETDGTAVQNARVHLEARDATGPFPYQESVSMTRSGSTVTVTHTGHGLASNDKVVIRGAAQQEYNGVRTITVTDANTYTFTIAGTPATPATGTPVSTFVALNGLTDVNGEISASRVYATDQPVRGRARKSSTAPHYKTADIIGVVSSSTGISAAAVMVGDD